MRSACGAGVFLNISANLWRISRFTGGRLPRRRRRWLNQLKAVRGLVGRFLWFLVLVAAASCACREHASWAADCAGHVAADDGISDCFDGRDEGAAPCPGAVSPPSDAPRGIGPSRGRRPSASSKTDLAGRRPMR